MIDLSSDLFEQIASYLEVDDLLELARVCRSFYYLTQDEYIWKKKCFQDFHITPDVTHWKSLYVSLKKSNVVASTLHKKSSEEREFTNIHSFEKKGVVDITVNADLIYGLDKLGSLWLWYRFEQPMLHGELVNIPERVQCIRFQSIVGRGCFNLGLAQDGTVWHWTEHTLIQKVTGIDAQVTQITCHGSYSSVLTNQGQVWFVSVVSEEGQTEAFLGLQLEDTIVQLVGLYHHTLALTRSGRVLLMATRDPRAFAACPRFIELKKFASCRNLSISGAFEDFLVMTKDGEILWGDIYATEDSSPRKDTNFNEKNITQIVVGMHHYGALTSKGELFIGCLKTDCYTQWLKDKYVLSVSFADFRLAALVTDSKEHLQCS
ncbi:hypothetical protein BY458DRAFT_522947 [Sporodiniella umbellata]|nr:hypothetical protein BY458DRAFT_522947 [Sporodiniella umbellata]